MLEVKVEDKTNRIVLLASAIFAIGQVIKLEIVLPVKMQKKPEIIKAEDKLTKQKKMLK